MGVFEWSVILLWCVILSMLFINFYLSKYVVNFLNRFRITGSHATKLDLSPGDTAPLFREKNQNKDEVKLVDNEGKDTILIFVKKDCSYCKEIISGLSLITKHIDNRIIIISREKIEYMLSDNKNIHFIISNEIFDNYFISSVPALIIVDPKLHITRVKLVQSFHKVCIIIGEYFNKVLNHESRLG
jgi:thioredoxin-related protein